MSKATALCSCRYFLNGKVYEAFVDVFNTGKEYEACVDGVINGKEYETFVDACIIDKEYAFVNALSMSSSKARSTRHVSMA